MIDFDQCELIEISADMHDGMLGLPAPMPPFSLTEVDLAEYARARKRSYRSYTQQVTMCVQAGTYLETAAHVYPQREKINEVEPRRLFPSAVVLHVPTPIGQKISAVSLEAALKTSGERINPGDAVIVASGDNFFDGRQEFKSPHFSHEAIAWLLSFKPGIVGSDMAGWQAADENPPLFPLFFESNTLLLAPLVNLDRIRRPRIGLIAIPLPLRSACASPCRVFAVLAR
jgi:kynurenine formamidase